MRAMEQKVTEAIDFPSWLVMKENCQQSICFTLFGDPGVSSTLQYVDGVVAVTVDDRSRGDDDVSSLSSFVTSISLAVRRHAINARRLRVRAM